MNTRTIGMCLLFCGLLAGLLAIPAQSDEEPSTAGKPEAKKPAQTEQIVPKPISPFIERGPLGWLVEAQHSSGGWGGGSHSAQQIRDPHAVKTDPATTSFAAMALIRSGHTPTSGNFKEAVRKATIYLVETVEKSQEDGPKITDIEGTQPQVKLGKLVDTTMTAQCLARVAATLPEDHELRGRVDKTLAKCVRKLEAAQGEDGGWNFGGGWAPVLQSSAGQQALELAQAVGQKVDTARLQKARDYHKKNFNAKTGKADASRGAGVELYAFSSAQRAAAGEARAANDIVAKAKDEGKLQPDAEVNEENLAIAGVAPAKAAALGGAVRQSAKQVERLGDQQLLRGFGNNGGEEFVSFLMTSESMILVGGKKWTAWNDKMQTVLEKVQNPDGSWNGHHCITSPVFCTAAVVQCLTADHDAELLVRIANQAAADETTKTASKDEAGKK